MLRSILGYSAIVITCRSQIASSHLCANPTHWQLDHHVNHRKEKKKKVKPKTNWISTSLLQQRLQIHWATFFYSIPSDYSLTFSLLAISQNPDCHLSLISFSASLLKQTTSCNHRPNQADCLQRPLFGFLSFPPWPVHQSSTNSALILDQSFNWPSFCIISSLYIHTSIISPSTQSSIHASIIRLHTSN